MKYNKTNAHILKYRHALVSMGERFLGLSESKSGSKILYSVSCAGQTYWPNCANLRLHPEMQCWYQIARSHGTMSILDSPWCLHSPLLAQGMLPLSSLWRFRDQVGSLATNWPGRLLTPPCLNGITVWKTYTQINISVYETASQRANVSIQAMNFQPLRPNTVSSDLVCWPI